MKIKMKRCINCNTLLSNSAKACTKCGGKELEKGSYSDQPSINNSKRDSQSESHMCPTCCAPVSIKHKECLVCEESLLMINGEFVEW